VTTSPEVGARLAAETLRVADLRSNVLIARKSIRGGINHDELHTCAAAAERNGSLVMSRRARRRPVLSSQHPLEAGGSTARSAESGAYRRTLHGGTFG
jgi:hypothetical protein